MERERIDWGATTPTAPVHTTTGSIPAGPGLHAVKSASHQQHSSLSRTEKQKIEEMLEQFDLPYESNNFGEGPVFSHRRGETSGNTEGLFPDDDLTDEDDDLSDKSIAAENAVATESVTNGADADDDDEEDEKNFMAVKPWLGSMAPPTDAPVMTEEGDNNWAAPHDMKLDLDYVYGYRSRTARQNLHWIDDTHVVFPAAAVGVVLDVKTTDQDFFFGHDDDIVCLDYHPERRLAASGSIGAHNSCRLCVWKVDQNPGKDMFNPLEQVQCWQGFHMFAVLGVAFSPDGRLICSFGMDEHHSIAIYHVDRQPVTDAGLHPLLAVSPADKNRLLHVAWNRCAGVDENTCFVTVGVKHVAFWTPKEASTKTKNYYEIEAEEKEQKLVWQRGFGCKEIDDLIFYSVSFSSLYALVGASNGCVYAFHATANDMRLKIDVSPTKNRILAMIPMNKSGDTFCVGDGAGIIRFYDISAEKNAAKIDVCKSAIISTSSGKDIDLNGLDAATDNESDIQVNSVRSLCYHAPSDKLLVGTILSQVYSIDVQKSAGGRKLSSRTLISGHWGSLREKEGYGEIWGCATHPSKQQMYTCSDDGTVRLWDIVSNKLLARHNLKYCCMKLDVSNDGSMVAVGHRNGSFTVLSGDLTKVLHHNTRHRKKRVMAIRFSPDNKMLAIGSEATIDLYTVRQKLKGEKLAGKHPVVGTRNQETGKMDNPKGIMARSSICKGHTALVNALDWNLSSTILQTTSNGYDLLYYAKDGTRVTGSHQLADQKWFTQTCPLGWSVQGIWPRFADGSDINSVNRAHSERYVAITNDWGRVRVFNYPCIGSGMDKFGQLKHRPESLPYSGHCSHVTNCCWTHNDEYLISTGGRDLCVFAWKVAYTGGKDAKPTAFLNARSAQAWGETVASARKERADEEAKWREEQIAQGKKPEEVEAEKVAEALQNDPLATLMPRLCVLCGHKFRSFEIKTCPRCNTPRRLTFAEPHAAWGDSDKKITNFGSAFGPGGAKAMAAAHRKSKIATVQGRYNLNTRSFNESSKLQKELRATVQSAQKSKPKTWAVNSAKAPYMPLPEQDDPDTDEELLKKKVTAKAKSIRAEDAKKKSAKLASKKPPMHYDDF